MSDESQRVTAAQVAHVENEIEVRAANIVRMLKKEQISVFIIEWLSLTNY